MVFGGRWRGMHGSRKDVRGMGKVFFGFELGLNKVLYNILPSR